MEYQKIANLLLASTSNILSKFRTRKWVEINDESRGNYANSDIRFKTTMLRSNLLCLFIHTCKRNNQNHWSWRSCGCKTSR